MRGADGEEAGVVCPLPIEIGNNEKRNLEGNLAHLSNLPVEITLSVGRVEVGAGVEIHDYVEPRRHKCLPERERVVRICILATSGKFPENQGKTSYSQFLLSRPSPH